MWVVWKLTDSLNLINLTEQVKCVVMVYDNVRESTMNYLPAYKTYEEAVKAYPYEKIYYLDTNESEGEKNGKS